MRGLYSSKTEIRHKIFTEIARMAYEGQSPEMLEELPYKIVPGEIATYRDSIFLERAVVGERLRVAMGESLGIGHAEALVCAAGAGVGFLVAMLLFCGVRQRVEASNPPESFKGLPITLISAAITSLSFMGFGGLVENIINAIL